MQLNQDVLQTDFLLSKNSSQLQLGDTFLSQFSIFSSIQTGTSNPVVFNHHFVQLFTGMNFRGIYSSDAEMITSIVFLKLVYVLILLTCLYCLSNAFPIPC